VIRSDEATTAMTLTAGTRLGRYEILGVLGAGGMGEVYRARDTRLDRDVAIKVLPDRFAKDPEALARFQREGRAAAALSHPNIRGIYDIGTDGDLTFAVMELLEGETLSGRLKSEPLSCHEALEIGLAVASGLAAAHAKGIVHRDIKPSNIFLDPNKGVKILDFGLARLKAKEAIDVDSLTETYTLETQPGVIMGTVAYMAPEQLRGQPADSRSDVFALGCVLYEMVAGRRPFIGESNADVMAAILHEPLSALSESGRKRPAELDRVIMRCLEKRPDQRFAAGREVVEALKNLIRKVDLIETWEATEPDTGESQRTGPAPRQSPAVASVAVLPFVNMSSDKENEYFSDGLAEELINVLTKVEGLEVAPRTSTFAFKGKNEDIRKIGEQLNVRTVLQGSVRKAGNRLRIAAQLVNVADSHHLWSETYNRELEDVFAIQDEIAQNITRALRIVLTEKDKRALEDVPTADVQAYDYYLRGRQFFHQLRRKSLEFARQMFARAIAIDPCYARAYAGMADCSSLLYSRWDASAANLQEADKASRKALELAPDLAEAHVARGLAVLLNKQHDLARQEFETALRLNPNLFETHYFYGRVCREQGQLTEAATLFERAAQLNPTDYQAPLAAANVYAGLGRQADAEAAYGRSLDLIEKHLDLHPDDARALYLGAIACCRLGQRDRGLDLAMQSLALDCDEPMTLYAVACVYAIRGQVEEAIDCLTDAVAHGYAQKEWIKKDADLQALHGHSRFQALVQGL
jgi:serine/threonine protein kinase/Flp pilus assembly protein TadD